MTIVPVVFAIGADPVKSALVTSFSRPGGNLSGAATLKLLPSPCEAVSRTDLFELDSRM